MSRVVKHVHRNEEGFISHVVEEREDDETSLNLSEEREKRLALEQHVAALAREVEALEVRLSRESSRADTNARVLADTQNDVLARYAELEERRLALAEERQRLLALTEDSGNGLMPGESPLERRLRERRVTGTDSESTRPPSRQNYEVKGGVRYR
jgi:hypothetical protein